MGKKKCTSSKIKFTLARLKALPATGDRYTVLDTEIPGLQCRVSPTGDKSFSIYKRPKGQHNPVRVKIHNISTIAAIKAEAQAINIDLASGVDPNKKARTEAILSITLEEAHQQYIASKQLAKGTVDIYKRAVDDMDEWRHKPLRDITRLMVLERYNKLIQRNPTAGRRMGMALSALWTLQDDLTDNGDFGQSPTVILNKQVEKWWKGGVRNRKISADALPAWLAAVRGLDSDYREYLEVLLLTGLRKGEAAGLMWKDVNLKAGYFIVRKTKNGTDHCLPITRRTRQILNSMRGNGKLVFDAHDPRMAIKQVTKECGVEFSPHDLRRTFTGLGDKSGAGSYAVKGALNHSPGKDVTAAHYAAYKPLDGAGNVDMDEVNAMREPLQKIEDYILSKAKAHRDNVLEVVK